MELGPCRVDKGGQDTTRNPYSWNSNANVIFLDQPVNVGFSYSEGSSVSTTEAAAEDVYAFLQVLLAALPQFAKAPFHLTGESYAGHYIPAMAKVIADRNREWRALRRHKEPDVLEIQLKSLAIGNGLTDPLIQYKYYADMAADKGCRGGVGRSWRSCPPRFPLSFF
jgi:cathepsin A (carboxypeptidase C)